MKQGDIAVINLDPTVGHEQAKTRPCVIIQCNTLNNCIGTTIIAPITSKRFDRPYPNIVQLNNNNNNLKKDSYIKLEQLRCIDKSRIQKIIGEVSNQEMKNVLDAIKVVFNF